MRNKFFILIFLISSSCIDLYTNDENAYYESVHIQGGGWFKFYENNLNQELEMENDFTAQVWFSGQEESSDEANCILNILSLNSRISIFRDPNIDDKILIYDDTSLIADIELDNLNFNQNEIFYLITIKRQSNQIDIYLNENLLINDYENDEKVKFIVGADLKNGAPENLWYGYIDEIRLWNDALADSIIVFHNQYPNKISASYNDVHLNSLTGLWDFRLDMYQDSFDNTFQDINQNLIYTNLYTLETFENIMSENGR